MRKIIFGSLFLLSFSAFAQSDAKCAKSIAQLAGASHDLGVYDEKVKAAEALQENSDEDPKIIEARISAMRVIRNAKRSVFEMSAGLIGVSCMSANMLQSNSQIKNEITARLPNEETEVQE